MIKGKALRRALATTDSIRLNGDVPLIVDKTELITPASAHEMLQKNKNNRPINWKKVEEYADLMRSGKWKLHSQGIILDPQGNILTGQKRLWAIVYSDVSVYMRVSRGCPADTAKIIDRGNPQTARDLAARDTERKHSPIEGSLAKGIAILKGQNASSLDIIADIMVEKNDIFQQIIKKTKGTKKSKSILMILSAICSLTDDLNKINNILLCLSDLSQKLDQKLYPSLADKCWGRGVAFVLAMNHAKDCVELSFLKSGGKNG